MRNAEFCLRNLPHNTNYVINGRAQWVSPGPAGPARGNRGEGEAAASPGRGPYAKFEGKEADGERERHRYKCDFQRVSVPQEPACEMADVQQFLGRRVRTA